MARNKIHLSNKDFSYVSEGEPGIIPGSMGTRSYIVCGKGNPEPFCSCLHGTGQRLTGAHGLHETSRRKRRAEKHEPYLP